VILFTSLLFLMLIQLFQSYYAKRYKSI